MVAVSASESQTASFTLQPPSYSKILIVDDDDRIVDALSSILARDGYQILSAMTGNTALELMRQQRPDVSIVDVLLPDVDGIEVCQRIKSDPEYRFQMVILMTGFSARGRRLNGLNAGADDFLNKPIDPVELVARVRSLLRTKQLYDEVEAHRQELEQRVAERTHELRAANSRLEQLNQVKSNVLAIVSHELRTPLAKIKSALWLTMQTDIGLEEKGRVQQMAQAACNLLEYRIADFGVLTDPSQITRSPVSIKDVIASAIEQVRVLQSGVDSPITIDVPRALPPVRIDPHAITRALAHVIDNAVKFGNDQPIVVRALVEGNKVRVDIEDHGIGIAEDLRQHVFSPLKQGDDSATRRHGGLGMGLALVKLIMEAHEAPIEIQSQQGKGTTVTVKFPVA